MYKILVLLLLQNAQKVINDAPVVAKKVVYCKHDKCKLKSHLSLRWGAVCLEIERA